MAGKKKTVLVVEDEKPMIQILSDRLELEDITVLSATDGQEGLQVALENHPDLIVLDILMPNMNGAEMLQQLVIDEWGKTAPVLCLTNVEEIPSSVRSIMSEYDTVEYMVKFSTRLDDIIERIQKLLEAH